VRRQPASVCAAAVFDELTNPINDRVFANTLSGGGGGG